MKSPSAWQPWNILKSETFKSIGVRIFLRQVFFPVAWHLPMKSTIGFSTDPAESPTGMPLMDPSGSCLLIDGCPMLLHGCSVGLWHFIYHDYMKLCVSLVTSVTSHTLFLEKGMWMVGVDLSWSPVKAQSGLVGFLCLDFAESWLHRGCWMPQLRDVFCRNVP